MSFLVISPLSEYPDCKSPVLSRGSNPILWSLSPHCQCCLEALKDLVAVHLLASSPIASLKSFLSPRSLSFKTVGQYFALQADRLLQCCRERICNVVLASFSAAFRPQFATASSSDQEFSTAPGAMNIVPPVLYRCRQGDGPKYSPGYCAFNCSYFFYLPDSVRSYLANP
jgi:hypothetical protein